MADSKTNRSLANASSEYVRIYNNIEVLTDGESYLWDELEQYFDVKMDTRGKSIFRRVCESLGRLYSPMAYPGRGLGIVMGVGDTVADIVEDKQRRMQNATARVVTVAEAASDYDNVPDEDMQYMRRLRAQNQALINAWRTKPVKRLKPSARITDGLDIKIPGINT